MGGRAARRGRIVEQDKEGSRTAVKRTGSAIAQGGRVNMVAVSLDPIQYHSQPTASNWPQYDPPSS